MAINERGEFIRDSTGGGTGTKGGGCGCFVIPVLFIGLLVYFTQNNNPQKLYSSPEHSFNLEFKASCGSSLGSGSTWYAVVGDKRAYNTVRNQYCGDSFIRPDGLLQIASFTSSGEAEKFAKELSQTTGLSFYVKY